jgi:hypothetical protein
VSIAGTFEIDTLLPAQYLIAAVDDPSIDGWPGEAWMAQAARGAEAVTLGRGDMREIQSLVLRSISSGLAPPRTHRWPVWSLDGALFGQIANPSPTTRFSVEGTVRDSTGRPAVRAAVTARCQNRWYDHSGPVFADGDGRYRLTGLEPGACTLTAEGDLPFSGEPVLVEGNPPLPMVVTDLADSEVTIDKDLVIELRLRRIRRPSFAGDWTLDANNSSAAVAKPPALDLGPPAASLAVYHKEETINLGEDRLSSGPIYRTDGSGEPTAFGAGRFRVEVNAVSRWQDERLVTRLTVPASATGPARTYEETRWLDKNGTMVVEVRGQDGSILRRSVYRKV